MVLIEDVDDAVSRVDEGDTLAVAGFVAVGIPEYLLSGLGDRYVETGTPGNLTLYHPAAEGDRDGNGVSHLAQDGMLKRVIGSHWGFVPELMERIVDGDVEAYNFPFGVMDHLLRDTGAGKPGTISTVGLETFVDPRNEGGKANDETTEDLVHAVELGGDECLFYESIPVDVTFIRATTADENGNLSMEREALTSNVLATAQAAHNSGGTVIAQVERVTQSGTLHPKDVAVPSVLVDSVVVAPEDQHKQTYAEAYNPAYAGDVRPPLTEETGDTGDDAPISARTVIARRAAMELVPDSVINIGVGVPELVPVVAEAGSVADEITQTVESGPVGGSPTGGISFGTATNHDALVSSTQQFDFYDGGGLDVGFLGMAQVDGDGNINVSRFGSQLPGCGGFINITQNAEKVVFCGTLTTGGLETTVDGGELRIDREGDKQKFCESVEQVTFSGDYAARVGQPVVYVTERAVFGLDADGLVLTEVAPGVDLDADVLDQLAFEPAVAETLELMDEQLFVDEPMDLTEYVR
ncbi:acyl CoA:acetate/3-ketoacid CoA transferase (plasmid) [Haloferax mediterranei ATCC 33500]|uniref:Acyl CoA:acetate/3-ketoacid CoA transferase n=1 Tax=Haloferax mediterranei (strain ATCC 33500 / DSM 1411 / JCM 8866 / NBRC 14739 / NCIMB 2177 / R-4) TaxID=523841 RepID=I3R9W4_HALMT|nr:acyl CoA:acetate/3-ketoacid CoA transferase [Haloferax mediterranei]AFK21024.1 putative acyl-CoA transferase (homolg to 3-oxoacid CoA-transferase) [Haloferax mediterranei ATCC 33500]AHZ24115.1 CoA-transferase [Haloferax mediterranei ATCC 33500]EMA05190.1 putative acyl-CoA transferase (homolg to 3-oxoacid CoA-transferase) [Haloferax mediterranei ATCC 33500]MDX5990002.1 acyl CoA:acetate/3-ketoacid CoA transferase [Haloferax mediterranei ATCC 33500]QCQ77185.1 acyl CoA:acetate/3-ketoacid CoA tr